MTGSLILIGIGLVALAVGGELLVRGAVGIAKKLGVSASEIREINHLDSGGNLAVGRWIKVPKPDPASTPRESASSAVAAAPRTETPAAPATPAPAPPAAEEKPVAATPAPTPAPAKVEAPAPAPTPAPATRPGSYQVQKGDTLFGIARKFGIKYQDLMAANKIDKPESLQAGQTLTVPSP